MKYLGLLSYRDGLRAQQNALEQLTRGTDFVLLGLEHHLVVTLGVRGNAETDVQTTASDLAVKGIEVVATGRGGQATLHSPGQLVIYPCVNLRAFDLGPRDYVELVQTVTQDWLGTFGIAAAVGASEPGLFIDGAKVAAFGFKISRGFTSHGLAINVRNDLGLFDTIRTCGVSNQRLTRMADHGVSETLEALFLSWATAFARSLALLRLPILTEAVPAH